MRTALIPVILFLTTSVNAQTPANGGTPAPAPRQTQAPRRPSPPPHTTPAPPRTVAPPIVFPMGPLTAPPAGGLTPPVTFIPGTGTVPPRDIFLNGRRNPYRNYASPGAAYGAYGSYATEPDATSGSPTPPGPAVVGFLRVSGTPSEAQVFVDGYFVGTVGDMEAGRPLMIGAGPHRLELRAPGYQSTEVDIRLAPNDTLTYRAMLDRAQPPAAPARTAASAASSTMYLIPNCYLGNVPPRANRLSPGCDIKQVQVLGAK
jgi:PEGA domain